MLTGEGYISKLKKRMGLFIVVILAGFLAMGCESEPNIEYFEPGTTVKFPNGSIEVVSTKAYSSIGSDVADEGCKFVVANFKIKNNINEKIEIYELLSNTIDSLWREFYESAI